MANITILMSFHLLFEECQMGHNIPLPDLVLTNHLGSSLNFQTDYHGL